MTSEQVLLLTAKMLLISGCSLMTGPGAKPLQSPYPTQRVWAVAPLRNESGNVQANGHTLADHLARQLENASNLDVLPVNRTLAAMEALDITTVSNPAQARQVLASLGADALVIGTITAYDPYDPPKLGLAIELYVNKRVEYFDSLDVRKLARAATSQGALPPPPGMRQPPSNIISAFFDAANPDTRYRLMRYARDRSQEHQHRDQPWQIYRINMDLYSEFVSYVMSWRLLRAETQRTAPPTTQPTPS
jgi:hypothetical protein